MAAPQRAQHVEESLAILVWWTLCPSSVQVAEADATGNKGFIVIGVGEFTTIIRNGPDSVSRKHSCGRDLLAAPSNFPATALVVGREVTVNRPACQTAGSALAGLLTMVLESDLS
jgi:hypothetical protein